MATIKIAPVPHPKDEFQRTKSDDGVSSSVGAMTYNTRPFARSDTPDTHDDIYNIRSRSRTDRGGSRMSTTDPEDDDPGLRKPGDFKQKQVPTDPYRISVTYAQSWQVFKGKMLLWLAYQSIGVIYGDIGTSPLYVYSATFSSAPSRQDLIGVLSIIIWSLFMMVTVKYVFVILHADNDGEGGTFSTYSLLSRYVGLLMT